MEEKKYPMKLNKNYYVVTANDLIKGRQKMTLREAQLLFIAISQVVYDDKDFKTYTTTVPELAEFMGVDENSLYRDLENICTNLLQRVVKIQVDEDDSKGRKKWKIFQWINSASYDNGTLTLRLSDDIKPFLLDLEAYYSQTLLGTLLTFNSYYATRLYQYLVAESNAHWGHIHEWSFTCEQIRELFQIKPKQYVQNTDLLKYTIVPALEEISASDYAYVWDYVENKAKRKGRPIESVYFKAVFFNVSDKKAKFIKKAKLPEGPLKIRKPRKKKVVNAEK